MAIVNNSVVKFVQVATLAKYNDSAYTKDPSTVYFVVDSNTIYVDGKPYGFSPSDAAQFLKLTGGNLTGDVTSTANISGVRLFASDYVSSPELLGGDEVKISVFENQLSAKLYSKTGTVPGAMFELVANGDTKGVFIGGVRTPVDNDHATNKKYVDDEIKTHVTDKLGKKQGIATLDASGTVPAGQLPSYVDDVVEFDIKADFPAAGEPSKIYVAKDTNKVYRWGGSAYTEISPTIAIGITEATAFRGDYGKEAHDHSLLKTGNPHKVTKSDVKLDSVENYGIATEAEAKAGSVSNKYMTPQRTKQAIAELSTKTVWTVVS